MLIHLYYGQCQCTSRTSAAATPQPQVLTSAAGATLVGYSYITPVAPPALLLALDQQANANAPLVVSNATAVGSSRGQHPLLALANELRAIPNFYTVQ
eukprot:COSAG06_NODE_5413_length_3499_cov_12.740588_3_plen_98_part_00